MNAERLWYNSDMDVAADLEQVRSLDAMWRAFRASPSSAQTLVELRTSVVPDVLNARYYDSTRGQLLSQDPIFLTSSQNLTDPQSLNAYSYSEDNPIVKSDPSGKCFEDLCIGETIGAVELADLAIPVIRAAIVTGAVNTDFNIAGNISSECIARTASLQCNARIAPEFIRARRSIWSNS